MIIYLENPWILWENLNVNFQTTSTAANWVNAHISFSEKSNVELLLSIPEIHWVS